MWAELESARLECQQAYWSLSCTFSDVFCHYVLLQSSEVTIRPLLWMRNWGRADGFTLAGGLGGRADTSAQVCLLSCHVLPPFRPTSCADSPACHRWNLGVYRLCTLSCRIILGLFWVVLRYVDSMLPMLPPGFPNKLCARKSYMKAVLQSSGARLLMLRFQVHTR